MGWFSWEPEIKNTISREALKILLPYYVPEATLVFMDKEYQVPTDPADVMANVPSGDYKYKKASRDCDDFVRIFRGWLSQKGYGNLLAMDCVFKHGDKCHAVIAFWHHSELVFGEPQSGKIIDMAKYPDYKIVRLIV